MTVKSSAFGLLTLINDILDYSKMNIPINALTADAMEGSNEPSF